MSPNSAFVMATIITKYFKYFFEKMEGEEIMHFTKEFVIMSFIFIMKFFDMILIPTMKGVFIRHMLRNDTIITPCWIR